MYSSSQIILTVETLLILNFAIPSTFSGSLSIFQYASDAKLNVMKVKDRTMVSESSVMIECQIVVSDPFDACESVQYPPTLSPSQDWVILTKLDDECGLGQKSSNAAKAGYRALLAKNTGSNDTGPYWVPTDTAASYGLKNNLIYVGVLGETDFNRLQKFAFPSRHYLRIEFEAARSTTFYVILIGGLFSIVFVSGLLLKIVFRNGNTQGNQLQVYPGGMERYRQLRRALRETITGARLHRIPVRQWSQSQFADSYSDTCAICLDGFSNTPENPVRIFNCCHAFHSNCIDPWIIKETTRCPTCMKNVFSRSKKDPDSSTNV